MRSHLKRLTSLAQHQFEIPLDYFDEHLARLDLTALTQLNEVVFEVASLAEFEVRLDTLLSQAAADTTLSPLPSDNLPEA